jgi:hypothetical protein
MPCGGWDKHGGRVKAKAFTIKSEQISPRSRPQGKAGGNIHKKIGLISFLLLLLLLVAFSKAEDAATYYDKLGSKLHLRPSCQAKAAFVLRNLGLQAALSIS